MQSMPTVGPNDVPRGSTSSAHGETRRFQRGEGQAQVAQGPLKISELGAYFVFANLHHYFFFFFLNIF